MKIIKKTISYMGKSYFLTESQMDEDFFITEKLMKKILINYMGLKSFKIGGANKEGKSHYRTDVYLSIFGIKFLLFRCFKLYLYFHIPGHNSPIPSCDKEYGEDIYHYSQFIDYHYLRKII